VEIERLSVKGRIVCVFKPRVTHPNAKHKVTEWRAARLSQCSFDEFAIAVLSCGKLVMR